MKNEIHQQTIDLSVHLAIFTNLTKDGSMYFLKSFSVQVHSQKSISVFFIIVVRDFVPLQKGDCRVCDKPQNVSH